jgi:hypothetical protein
MRQIRVYKTDGILPEVGSDLVHTTENNIILTPNLEEKRELRTVGKSLEHVYLGEDHGNKYYLPNWSSGNSAQINVGDFVYAPRFDPNAKDFGGFYLLPVSKIAEHTVRVVQSGALPDGHPILVRYQREMANYDGKLENIQAEIQGKISAIDDNHKGILRDIASKRRKLTSKLDREKREARKVYLSQISYVGNKYTPQMDEVLQQQASFLEEVVEGLGRLK